MVQSIGLIVGVYVMVRLIQIPIRMSVLREDWSDSWLVRLVLVSVLSGLGAVAVMVLTIALLNSGV